MDQSEVSAEENPDLSTLLFCRTCGDGTIAPDWDASREAELAGQFEIGLTVAQRYLLKRKLGAGSMGCVFLAQDLRLDRPVAMKVVSHRRPTPTDLESVLQREAKLGAKLNHKGIATVYDFGFHENKSYTIVSRTPQRAPPVVSRPTAGLTRSRAWATDARSPR